ncbi:MAG TPA: hypothetical protein GXX19_09030 [Syntrophomonadaceae bacterium]|nr:hypothetical protein [Syntrophomonadaceae bacterium]
MTEKDIQNGIRQFLRMNGFFVIRNQQGLGSHPGMTDLTAVKDGQVYWIEIKKPGGRLSRVQEKFRDSIRAAGGNWMVATSVEDVIREIPGLRGLFGAEDISEKQGQKRTLSEAHDQR